MTPGTLDAYHIDELPHQLTEIDGALRCSCRPAH